MLDSVYPPGHTGAQTALQALSPFMVADPPKISPRVKGFEDLPVIDGITSLVIEDWKACQPFVLRTPSQPKKTVTLTRY